MIKKDVQQKYKPSQIIIQFLSGLEIALFFK